MNITSENLKAQAKQDHGQANKELLKTLKNADPQNLSPEDLALIAKLAPEERQKLFASIGKQPRQARRPNRSLLSSAHSRSSHWLRLHIGVRRPLVALLIGCGVASIYPSYTAATAYFQNQQPLNIDVDSWPLCERLDRQTDNCVYAVAEELTWDDATSYLNQSTSLLVQNNSHLDRNSNISQGQQLIVWRGKRQLEK